MASGYMDILPGGSSGAPISVAVTSLPSVTVTSAPITSVVMPTVKVTADFARPAGTDIYAANDVMSDSTTASTVLTFAAVARAVAGSGYISKARMVMNSAVTTNAVFRLWLFNAAPAAINDNAAFPLLWANRTSRIGYIDFAMTTEGTGSDCAESTVSNIRLPFTCGAALADIYGIIEVRAAYTPISQGAFSLILSVDQN